MCLSILKLAEMGMECFMPFFQSRVKDEVNNLLSLVWMLLAKAPEYDIEIFSYQRSLPTGFFLFKG